MAPRPRTFARHKGVRPEESDFYRSWITAGIQGSFKDDPARLGGHFVLGIPAFTAALSVILSCEATVRTRKRDFVIGDGSSRRDVGLPPSFISEILLTELVKIELPDGQEIWANMRSETAAADVGWSSAHRVRLFSETVRAVAENVHRGVRGARPDQISVEFGLELAMTEDGLVTALAGLSGAASVTVTLAWNGSGTTSGS